MPLAFDNHQELVNSDAVDVVVNHVDRFGDGLGTTVERANGYLNDKKNGATMLSIPFGHAADALCHCLGEVRQLSPR